MKEKKKKYQFKTFLAPINVGHSNGGRLTEEIINFYEARAGNSIGVCYVGNVAIERKYKTNKNTLCFDKCDYLKWKVLTQTIKGKGSVPAVQLGCRYSKFKSQMEFENVDGEIYVDKAIIELQRISGKEIERIIDSYMKAIKVAWKLGFEIVQIHAAHGYFLSLMASKTFNKRTDKYNAIENYIINTIISQTKKDIPNLLIDIRISFYELKFYEEDEERYKIELIEKIIAAGADMVSLSNGIYNIDKNMIYLEKKEFKLENIRIAQKLSAIYPDMIFNVAGALTSNDIKMLDDNSNLTFSFGRALIRDPEFLLKYYNNELINIKQCTRCGQCHYYSRGQKGIFKCWEKEKD